MPNCMVEHCDEPARLSGWCEAHLIELFRVWLNDPNGFDAARLLFQRIGR